MAKYDVSIPGDMLDVINNCTVGLAGVGLISGTVGPGADLLVIGPVWVGMTVSLANKAGSRLSEQTAKKVALAVLTGAGTFLAGTKVASTILGWIGAAFTLGASVVASAAANAAINAAFTRSYGRSVARFFLAGEQIDSVEVAIQILIALTGRDYGFDTPYDDMI